MTVEITSVSGLTTGTTTSTAAQEMDSEMFLQLLVAQLTNQDPSSPMDTADMMNQQVQLASMEQLTNLTDVTQEQFSLTMRMAAMDLVGQTVTYTDADGEVVTGEATSASFANAVPSIQVGDESVDLDLILSIVSPTDATSDTDSE